jgi:hypothetical protein
MHYAELNCLCKKTLIRESQTIKLKPLCELIIDSKITL